MIGPKSTSNAARILPEPFVDIEPFADWALPTETARLARRLASDMDSIRAFHDAVLPRVEEIFAYLNRFALDALPENAKRLLFVALALAEVAPCIYFYNEPMPSDVYDPKRFVRWDVPNMTPEI